MAKDGAKKPKSNGGDAKKIGPFVEEILEYHAHLDRLSSEHMTRCRSVREDIKAVLDDAKDSGLTKKTVKEVVKRRLTAKKFDKIRDESDDQNLLDSYEKAMAEYNDVPFGEAPVDKAVEVNDAANDRAGAYGEPDGDERDGDAPAEAAE